MEVDGAVYPEIPGTTRACFWYDTLGKRRTEPREELRGVLSWKGGKGDMRDRTVTTMVEEIRAMEEKDHPLALKKFGTKKRKLFGRETLSGKGLDAVGLKKFWH